jgi:GNAT superfamily N-acetyltransferase
MKLESFGTAVNEQTEEELPFFGNITTNKESKNVLPEEDNLPFFGNITTNKTPVDEPVKKDQTDKDLAIQAAGGDFLSGLKGSFQSLQASLYGAAGLAGSATDAENIKDFGFEGYQRNISEASKYPTKTLRDVKEAEGFADTVGTAVDWVQGAAGKILPSMATAAIGSVVGAIAGSATAGPAGTVAGGVGGLAAKTILKKAINTATKKEISRQIKNGLIKEGGEAALEKSLKAQFTKQALQKLGGKIGMGAAVLPMEAGGNYGELLAEKGIDAPGTALFFGALATSLEYLGGNSRLIDNFIDTIGKGSGGAIKKSALQILRNMPEEALQEAGQEALSILNTVVNTDEKFLTPENIERMVEAGGVGAIGGGFGSVAGTFLNSSKADTGFNKDKTLDKVYKNITSYGSSYVSSTINRINEDISKANEILQKPEMLKQQADALSLSVEELTNNLQEQIANSTQLKERLSKFKLPEASKKVIDVKSLVQSIREKTNWDKVNRSSRSDAWFEGARVNEKARKGFIEALEAGGQDIQAHGMAKENTFIGGLENLLNLLKGGLNPNRGNGRLYTAPLVSKAGEGLIVDTASGSAYNEGPFMLLARPEQELVSDLSGVGAILVNETHADVINEIRDAVHAIRPDIIVETYGSAGSVVRQLKETTEVSKPKEYWQVWEDEIKQQRQASELKKQEDKKYQEAQKRIQENPDYQRRKALQEKWNAEEKTTAEKEAETIQMEVALQELQRTEGLTDEEIRDERANFYEKLWGTYPAKDAKRSAEVFTEQSDEEYRAIEKAVIQKHIENIMQETDRATRERAYDFLFGGVKDAAESFDIFNKTDLITRKGKPYQRREFLEGYLADRPDAANWDIAEVPGGFVGIRKIIKSTDVPVNKASTFTDEQQVESLENELTQKISDESGGGKLQEYSTKEGNPVGYTIVRPDNMFQAAAKRMYKEVDKNDKVLRLSEILVEPEFQGKGFGQKLLLEAFKAHPGVWLGNSQIGLGETKEAAINALEKVPGIEIHWAREKGGHFVARLKTETNADTLPEFELRQNNIPGKGLKRQEIQKMFPGQNVFFGDNNTISVRLKNGKGITFQTIQDAGKGFIEYAIQTGQMSKNGKILGVTIGNKILIDSQFADTKTGWHENLHALENLGMITPEDISAINEEFNKLRKSNQLGFALSTHTDPIQRMKENRANTFAQIMVNREQYRDTPLGKIIQKVKDFFDQIYVMGKRFLTSNQDFQTSSSLAREVESGKFYDRPIDGITVQDVVDTNPFTVETFPQLTYQEKTSTKTQVFKKWFGKSKTRDKETDEPMIFYHYSPEPITEFKHMPGANTGHATSGLGHFFFGKKDPDAHYGQYEIAGYLKMEKPYFMGTAEASSFTTVNEAMARQQELRDKGYDSIIIDNSEVDGMYVGGQPYFVIFDSNHVKSIYNSGNWDLNENNIYLQVSEPSTEQSIPQEEYDDVYNQKANLLEKIQQLLRMKSSEIKLMADKSLTPISTRLKKIDNELAMKMRELDFKIALKINSALQEAYPIMKTKMSSEDKVAWDWARKNSDEGKINQLVEKYGFQENYNNLRNVLNQIRQDAIDVGYDVGFVENYWPRIIKDQEGFLQATQEISRRPEFTEALKERADKLGISVADLRERFPDVTADIISNVILGRSSGIGGPGNIQGRVFDKIPVEYANFYMNSDAALMQYIYSMTKKIEARKFFGKVPENISKIKQKINSAQISLLNLEQQEALLLSESSLSEEQQKLLDSYREQKTTLMDNIRTYNGKLEEYKLQRDYTENIGALINDLMIAGKLNKNDEKSLREILDARFHERGTTGIVHNYKNFSYIDVMGSPFSAITQIGDLAWAMYVGKAWTPKGFADTTKHLVQAIFKQSNITKEDLGIERMAQEFADFDSFSNLVSKVFKVVGLEKMDSIGKELLINNAFSMYKKQVQTENGRRELLQKIRPIFGTQSNQVINELLALSEDSTVKPSDNVKMLLYSRLLDFQPVALSEMPEYYLKGGNWRILYMLKTYTIKQLDVFRNEVYREFKNGDINQKIGAMKNMVQLMGVLVLANAGADELKDFLLGKETKLEDNVIENLLTIGGANRYVRMQAQREGIGTAVTQLVLPPFKFINSLGKDVSKGNLFDLEESKTLESIPLIGKLAYWHVGRGSEYRPSVEEQDFLKIGRKFNKFKKDFEESNDKRLFLQTNIDEFKQMKIYEGFNSSTKEITALINKLKKIEQTTNVRKRIGQLEERKNQIMQKYFELTNN